MNKERLMKILLGPHISEKATVAADENRQFVFRVARDASKPQIKQAVELLFDVKVDGVRVANVHGKRKRFGSHVGKRVDYKKAYVSLQEGFDIEMMGPQ
jgi:large subunit ribosomal protein L23